MSIRKTDGSLPLCQFGAYLNKNDEHVKSFRNRYANTGLSSPVPQALVWYVTEISSGKLLGTVKAFGESSAIKKAYKDFGAKFGIKKNKLAVSLT